MNDTETDQTQEACVFFSVAITALMPLFYRQLLFESIRYEKCGLDRKISKYLFRAHVPYLLMCLLEVANLAVLAIQSRSNEVGRPYFLQLCFVVAIPILYYGFLFSLLRAVLHMQKQFGSMRFMIRKGKISLIYNGVLFYALEPPVRLLFNSVLQVSYKGGGIRSGILAVLEKYVQFFLMFFAFFGATRDAYLTLIIFTCSSLLASEAEKCVMFAKFYKTDELAVAFNEWVDSSIDGAFGTLAVLIGFMICLNTCSIFYIAHELANHRLEAKELDKLELHESKVFSTTYGSTSTTNHSAAESIEQDCLRV